LKFIEKTFGLVCDVYERLWCRDHLKPVPSAVVEALAVEFPPGDVKVFKVCATCRDSLVKSKISLLSSSNRLKCPEMPIYEKRGAAIMATPCLLMRISHVEFANLYARTDNIGDVCVAEVMVDSVRTLFVFLYINPNTSTDDIECFLLYNMMVYSPRSAQCGRDSNDSSATTCRSFSPVTSTSTSETVQTMNTSGVSLLKN
jgi:hypothetical protein